MDLLIKGKLPIKDLCARCLARAKKYKHLNFLVAQVADETIDDMHQERDVGLDDQQKQLKGIPIAVKSNFSTIGMETSCASRMLQNYVPTYNATVVQKLLDQDAVLIGKTNLDEFAMGSGTVDSIHGPVYNPWSYMLDGGLPRDKQDWLVAGGSSGGSAVAVATGSSLIALASDTGGSTRNPASYCGVVGLKPTYGLLSRHGLIPLVNSMDVPGILTCSIDAAAATLNILAGHDIMDSTTLTDSYKEVILDETPKVKGLHIGIPKEYFAPGLSSEVASWWDRVAGMLDNAGATVSQVSLPHTQYSIVCYHILGNCEVASNMARYDGIEFGHRAAGAEQSTEQLFAMSRHEGFNDVVRGRILAGNYFLLKRNYDAYFLKAQKVRRLISEDFSKVFDGGIDLLLTPTTLTDAPTYRSFSSQDNRTQSAKQDVLTQSVNLAGLPAVSVPVGLSSRHLPIGLQLIGQFQGEQTMLSVAKWIETQVNFPYFEWEKYT